MTDFSIRISESGDGNHEVPNGVAVFAHDQCLTRLMRPGSSHVDDYLRAPPIALSFWLVDNWWRLRWEAVPPIGMTPEWRLAHEMSSIGGGYVWPRLSIWGAGERVGLASKSDPPGITGPVRYIVDALMFVSVSNFEHGVDALLAEVLERQLADADELRALRSQFDALNSERHDSNVAAWRRVEARLGFDPDGASDSLIEEILELAKRYGKGGIEEAVSAAPGPEAGNSLRRQIEVARASRIHCNMKSALANSPPIVKGRGVSPWRLAEAAAKRLRDKLQLDTGPIRNSDLSDVLGTTAATVSASGSAMEIPYSLRLGPPASGPVSVALRNVRPQDRRFDLVRVLGDAIWARQDMLGPVGESKTDRQMFQRAFAQSFLCPFQDLRDFLATNHPSDGDISAAARHFAVSERVIRSLLVNKRVIPRGRLMPADTYGYDPYQLDEELAAA